jgi:hypothetical protein
MKKQNDEIEIDYNSLSVRDCAQILEKFMPASWPDEGIFSRNSRESKIADARMKMLEAVFNRIERLANED